MSRTFSKLASAAASFAAAILLAVSLVPVPALAAPAEGDAAPAQAGSVAKVADPDTSNTWTALFEGTSKPADGATFSTQEAGRIWVDKSVYATAGEAEAAGVPVPQLDDPDLDFLVGLSAMSSAASVRPEQTVPHDVVFVVSLNSTLASYVYDGKTYAEHLANALNEAIGRLMAENDDDIGPEGPTRIAVVGYSMDTTVLMPLDTYQPDENGDYLVFSRAVAGGSGLHVTATPETASASTADGPFRGYAYLQRAISIAGGILEDAAEQSTAEDPRSPALVVMGTEVAAAANTNIADPPAYALEAQGENGFLGSLITGHSSGYGTDAALATLLTLQHVSNRIDAAYAGSGEKLSLYTVGLDAQALGRYVLQTAQGQADNVVEGTGEAIGVNLCDTIDTAREAYAQAAEEDASSVTLSLYTAGSRDLVKRDVVFPDPMPGLLSPENGYAFRGADEYLPATDAGALPDAFSAAVDYLLGVEYLSPVNPVPSEANDSADRLRMEDDLGQGMIVKRIDGIEFEGALLDGSLAAAAVAASFNDPWDMEAYHEVQYLMYALNERYDLGWDAYSLLYDALADGQIAYRGDADYSNCASWYVDDDHDMIPSEHAGYTFASTPEVEAIVQGRTESDPSSDVRAKIAAAKAAGATALCQTYFYIGNLENQYTGADVPLYDFVVMVETRLDTGAQTVLFSAPADSIPAREASVVELTDGGSLMTLEPDALSLRPMRLVYEVGPRKDAAEVARRIMNGEDVGEDEIAAAFGENARADESGSYLLYESVVSRDEAGAASPGATMTTVTAATDAYYSFTSDTPLYELADGSSVPEGAQPAVDDLVPLRTLPEAGRTYYYEQAFYEASDLAPGVASPAHAARAFTPYVVSVGAADIPRYFFIGADDQCRALAHTPKFSVSALVDDYAKHPNATATTEYSKQLSISEYRALGEPLLKARLGNNGVLAVAPPRDGGSLTVSTSVSAQDPADVTGTDRDKPFFFRATLADATGAPLAGTIEIVGEHGAAGGMIALDDAGSVTFSLSDGQSLRFPDLPAGATAVVEELSSEGGTAGAPLGFDPSWTVSVAGAQTSAGTGATAGEATIEADAETRIAFENAKATGTVVLSKQVAGNAADPVQTFAFDVSLEGPDATPLSGEFPYRLAVEGGGSSAIGTATTDATGALSLEGGEDIALSSGQSLVISGIPVGASYTIAEHPADAAGYDVSAVRSVDGGAPTAFDGTGSIEATGQRDEIAFVNKRWAYGSLVVEKQVSGTDITSDHAFSFTVSLVDETGAALSGAVECTHALADGTQTTETKSLAADGTLSFSLKGGETMAIDGIPQGTRYAIEEDDCSDEGFIVKRSDDEGVIGAQPATVRFVNVKQAGALGIAKIVGGNAGDRAATWSFEITVEGMFQGSADTEKTFELTRYLANGTEASGSITFTRDGDAGTGTATLEGVCHNEGALIKGLASNAAFTVKEIGAADLAREGYRIYAGSDVPEDAMADVTESGGTYHGTLKRDAAVGVYFANVKDETGCLAIEKRVEGDAAIDEAQAGRAYLFSIAADDAAGTPVTGTFTATVAPSDASGTSDAAAENGAKSGEDANGASSEPSTSVAFTNGTATVRIPAGSTVTICDLPAGASYRVAEEPLDGEGYATYASGAKGSIPANGTASTLFVNEKSYSPVDVAISGTEVLRGRAQQAGEFAFALYESDGETPVTDAEGNPITCENAASPAGVAVPFSLSGARIDHPGAYSFVVKEQVPPGTSAAPGVTYDDRVYTVVVTVAADVTGALAVESAAYSVGGQPASGIAFTNEYRTTTGSFQLSARKTLDGAPLEADAFVFEMQEIDPATDAALSAPVFARNDDEGSIDFGTFSISAPVGGTATRSFVVREAFPPDATPETGFTAGGVTYDTDEYRYDVTATSDGTDGALDIAVDLQVRSLDAYSAYGPWRDADDNTAAFHNVADGGEGPDVPPIGPDDPDDPDNPSDPDNPDNPDDPSDPDNPDDPDTPGQPDDPDNPSDPSDPDTPGGADDPVNPGTPTDPSQNPEGTSTPSKDGTLSPTGDAAIATVAAAFAAIAVAAIVALVARTRIRSANAAHRRPRHRR